MLAGVLLAQCRKDVDSHRLHGALVLVYACVRFGGGEEGEEVWVYVGQYTDQQPRRHVVPAPLP